MDAAPLDDLAAHAHDASVVVIGGGIGGLVAALSCAKIGIRVTVVEASGRLGGALHTAAIDGVAIDLGAEGFATRGGAVRELLDELGLGASIVPASPRVEWISGLPGGPVPIPDATLRGIPENPFDEGVRRLIGWRGAWRAYLDRLRPPLTIGQEHSLGRLVRNRMGDLVLDRLLAPLSIGAFAIHPDDVEVEAVAPGLSAALTRTGSLAGGVAQVRAAAAKGAAGAGDAAPGFEGVDGGMSRLVEALQERLVELGARVVVGERVSGLSARSDGMWDVHLDSDDGALDPAHHVIVATGAADAHRLLRGAVPSLEPVPAVELDVVALVLSSDAAPSGGGQAPTAVYAIPGTSAAASVTDSTARWAWVAREAGTGVRVLKVTFGGPGVTPATAALGDTDATDLALAEASAMLGVPLDHATLRGSHRARYLQPPPISAIGRREESAAAREAIHAVPGLSAVGAWVAGTGIAQVVPDALEEAERVRRAVLWDDTPKTSTS